MERSGLGFINSLQRIFTHTLYGRDERLCHKHDHPSPIGYIPWKPAPFMLRQQCEASWGTADKSLMLRFCSATV